ncbi:MAG: hypothetical protein R3293_25290, partial [Candidatus Promineifilaceae bacterium]|nr:hypothetical protein [Candidatus Promineifilaceae bacterium]
LNDLIVGLRHLETQFIEYILTVDQVQRITNNRNAINLAINCDTFPRLLGYIVQVILLAVLVD